MSKVYVVYWTGTGNTKRMADRIGEGILNGGRESLVAEVNEVNPDDLKDMTAFALGCPSMGAEELDPEMDEFVEKVTKFAGGKKIGLFGSYGWGNCEWMRDWEDRLKNAGAEIILEEGITCLDTPDDDTLDQCFELGKKLASL